MTLFRTTARTLLASSFVVNGVKAVRNPEPLVPVAQPVADRVGPLLKQYAPASVAGYVPEDTASLVRAHAGLQLLGGLALASGKFRRLGAGLLAVSVVPSTLAQHPFWQETDPEAKAKERAQFLKNTSLFGGALLASADTEGRPSLAWRAQQSTRALSKSTSSLVKDTRSAADSAVSQGAVLLGAVAAGSRKATERASKEFSVARKAAEKQASVAAKRSKQMRKDAKKLGTAATIKAAERAAARNERIALQERLAAADRKRAAAQTKRAALVKKRAAEEHKRAAMTNKRAAEENKRAALTRKRAAGDHQRAALLRRRAAAGNERAAVESRRAAKINKNILRGEN